MTHLNEHNNELSEFTSGPGTSWVIHRARLRPWPGGPAAPVGCKLSCLSSMARKGAWLRRATLDLSAWLSGNDRNPRFFRAALVCDARGRFWAAAGWLARALAGRGNFFARVPAPALAAAREAKWRRFRRPLYTGFHSPLSRSSTRCLLFYLPRERPAVSGGAWRWRRPPAGCGFGHRRRGSSPCPRSGYCWDSVAAVFLFFSVRICFVFFPICILYFHICLLSVVWTPSQGEIDPQSSFCGAS